ncbi:MAG: DNA-3-methyladenine glycosylase I [Salinisphaeraceae bacterium]|nr:DNA-3-methyladenine glycosylase I [Salinisphaeraceae bacterium]
MTPTRCGWCTSDPEYIHYHDKEWGVPLHDDQQLFELLILEGAQAGLSWLTVLKKRPAYREAFEGFDPATVAKYTDKDVQGLLGNAGIIRNRLKIQSAIRNAKAFLNIQDEFGSFADYWWGFVDGQPIQNHWRSLKEVPAKTELSDQISKDLKKRGFNFVGSTIIYAYMQSSGLVNDHTTDCFRYTEVVELAAS